MKLTSFRRIAAEAIVEQARAMQTPHPGYFMIRCCRLCPEVAAAIFWCSHEPGLPENVVDQPYLQGQIALTLTDPIEIWTRPKREISREFYERELAWHRWAEKNAPAHPDFLYRRPVDKGTAPPPRFA